MSFRVFAMKGGDAPNSDNYPFKAIVSNSTSGISKSNINTKCPCDTGIENYTSSNFLNFNSPTVVPSGVPSVKIYSGSMLYQSTNIGDPFITSYVDNVNVPTEDEETTQSNAGVFRIYGLNSPIFIHDFVDPKINPNDTLKIWLTVCYPSGQDEGEASSSITAADVNDFVLHDCKERANKPMAAFVSCGTNKFPKSAVFRLINKGTSSQPRYEKRQVMANIPIAEITSSGTVSRQFLNANLLLVDMNVQGFPCKMPMSLFSEIGT